MQKYHDEPKQYKGYLKSALRAANPTFDEGLAFARYVDEVTCPQWSYQFL